MMDLWALMPSEREALMFYKALIVSTNPGTDPEWTAHYAPDDDDRIGEAEVLAIHKASVPGTFLMDFAGCIYAIDPVNFTSRLIVNYGCRE